MDHAMRARARAVQSGITFRSPRLLLPAETGRQGTSGRAGRSLRCRNKGLRQDRSRCARMMASSATHRVCSSASRSAWPRPSSRTTFPARSLDERYGRSPAEEWAPHPRQRPKQQSRSNQSSTISCDVRYRPPRPRPKFNPTSSAISLPSPFWSSLRTKTSVPVWLLNGPPPKSTVPENAPVTIMLPAWSTAMLSPPA